MQDGRVAATFIVKDGAETIEAAIGSVRPHVDEVCVYLDCRQADATPDLLGRLAQEPGVPVRVEYGPEPASRDLASAARRSFEMTAAPWVVWLDADDILRGAENLRGIVAEAEAADVDHALVLYDTSTAATVWRERVVRRELGRSWEGRVHYFIRAAIQTPCIWVHPDRMHVWHQAREPRSPHRYITHLEQAIANGDDRAHVYLGLNLLEVGGRENREQAADVLSKYLSRRLWEVEGEWNGWYVEAAQALAYAESSLGFGREATERRARVRRYIADWHEAFRRGEAPDPQAPREPAWARGLETLPALRPS